MIAIENVEAKRERKTLVLILVVFLSFSISVKTSLWIAERFFFDRLIYYKSIKHGYLIPGKYLPYQAYGKRGSDLANLETQSLALKNGQSMDQVLGITDDGIYTVAVIGDSLVWGQGLREKDRFANILERQLSRIYPTKVLSLGYAGDSMADNYIKYRLINTLYPNIDLYIVGVVDNDLFINQPDRYDSSLFHEITQGCRDKTIFYDPPFDPSMDIEEQTRQYAQNIRQSFSEEYANICIFHRATKLLPKSNAMYITFRPRDVKYDEHLRRMIEIMQENSLFILTVSQYFENMSDEEMSKKYYISEREGHPSAFANHIFAEALFQEITQDQRWGFGVTQKKDR